MKDIFEGLESFGLEDIEEKVLFQEDAYLEDEGLLQKQKEEMMREMLFDRKAECPICDLQFSTRSVKAGKLKLIESDEDLRPIYNKFDPLVYDIMVCPTCGYASLAKTFKYVKEYYIPEFKEKVSNKYRAKMYPEVYSYDDGIERYKLALYCAMILNKSSMEKAYLCLKIAWLYRGKGESISKNDDEAIREAYDQEMVFIAQAYEGFKVAVESEKFPQLGIDKMTSQYLVGELARRLGKLEEASEIMKSLSIANFVSQRLKLRIEHVRDLIREAYKNKELAENEDSIDK